MLFEEAIVKRSTQSLENAHVKSSVEKIYGIDGIGTPRYLDRSPFEFYPRFIADYDGDGGVSVFRSRPYYRYGAFQPWRGHRYDPHGRTDRLRPFQNGQV